MDGVGYTISVESIFYPNVVLTVSNTCYYPQPQIVGIDDPYCLGTNPFTLIGDANGADGVGSFTVNGNPTINFDASALGVGSHLIEFTFDAGTAGSNDPNDPGCVASTSQFVQVIETPSILACNNSLNVSLDENCQAIVTPDFILEGTYGCFDDYEVVLTEPNGNVVLGNIVNLSLIHI